MATLRWWVALSILCLIGTAAPAADLTQENLEKRKQVLETEYQDLAKEADRLKKVKDKLKGEGEKRLYNDWVEALNQRVAAYEKNRKALEKDAATFRAALEGTAAAAPPVEKPPAPEEMSAQDRELTATRERLQQEEATLNSAYQALMKEKERLSAAMEAARSGDGEPVSEETVQAFNRKIQDYEKKRQALNADLDAYNARVKQTAPPVADKASSE